MDFKEEMALIRDKFNAWATPNKDRGIIAFVCDGSEEILHNCVIVAGQPALASFTIAYLLSDKIKVDSEQKGIVTTIFRSALFYLIKEGSDDSFMNIFNKKIRDVLLDRLEDVARKYESDETKTERQES